MKMGSAGMSPEKVGGTMSTIRWWYESLEWKKKPKMTIQGGAGRRKREKNVQTESGIEDLLPQRFSASKNISTEFWYLMHFSRTSLTNLGLGFSGSTAKQSDLGRGSRQVAQSAGAETQNETPLPWAPCRGSSPVIPAPPELEVAQVVSKPVAQSGDKVGGRHLLLLPPNRNQDGPLAQFLRDRCDVTCLCSWCSWCPASCTTSLWLGPTDGQC